MLGKLDGERLCHDPEQLVAHARNRQPPDIVGIESLAIHEDLGFAIARERPTERRLPGHARLPHVGRDDGRTQQAQPEPVADLVAQRIGVADDAMLGRGIGGEQRIARADPGLRGGVADPAFAGRRQHPPAEDARTLDRADQIDLDLPGDVLIGEIEGERGPADAGVVEQQVDAAHPAPGEIGQRLERIAIADVADLHLGLDATRGDLAGGAFRLLAIDVGNDDRSGTLIGQRQGDAAADAGRATGDDCARAGDLHSDLSPWACRGHARR